METMLLPRQKRVSINRIRTEHGKCFIRVRYYKDNETCDGVEPEQTMNHTAETCAKRLFVRGTIEIYRVTKKTVERLNELGLDS